MTEKMTMQNYLAMTKFTDGMAHPMRDARDNPQVRAGWLGAVGNDQARMLSAGRDAMVQFIKERGK